MGEWSNGRRRVAVLVIFLLGSFVVALGLQLRRDDPLGPHQAVIALGWVIVLVSVVPIKKKGWRLLIYLPTVWLLASVFTISFIGPARSLSYAITMPAECRGVSDYWDQIEIFGSDSNNRHDLVMTGSVETQRGFNTIVNAAEQDIERARLINPPAAAREFHRQFEVVSLGWIDIYHEYWNGTLTQSMMFDLQDEDDLLESYQIDFANACGQYAGIDGEQRPGYLHIHNLLELNVRQSTHWNQ